MSGSKRDDDTLVVDNTNTTVEEISPYMLGAAAFGWEAEVHTLYLTLHDDAIRSAARNVHNVPEQVVLSQYQRLLSRKLPSYWKCVSKSARF